ATAGATLAGVLAPAMTNGEHSTGWLWLEKARRADSITWSQTSGELALMFPVTTGWLSMYSSPNKIRHMRITSSAFLPEVVMPMNVLSECLMDEYVMCRWRWATG